LKSKAYGPLGGSLRQLESLVGAATKKKTTSSRRGRPARKGLGRRKADGRRNIKKNWQRSPTSAWKGGRRGILKKTVLGESIGRVECNRLDSPVKRNGVRPRRWGNRGGKEKDYILSRGKERAVKEVYGWKKKRVRAEKARVVTGGGAPRKKYHENSKATSLGSLEAGDGLYGLRKRSRNGGHVCREGPKLRQTPAQVSMRQPLTSLKKKAIPPIREMDKSLIKPKGLATVATLKEWNVLQAGGP